MMPIDKTETGTRLSVRLPEQSRPVPAEIHSVPFFDPKKEIPVS